MCGSRNTFLIGGLGGLSETAILTHAISACGNKPKQEVYQSRPTPNETNNKRGLLLLLSQHFS